MKKVLTVGVFDYFHLGHLRLLEQARECGDYLIVAVQDDGCVLKYKPDADVLYSLDERIEMMMAVKCVDEVIVYGDVDVIVKEVDFDVFAVGEDQTHEGFQRAVQFCLENGKEVARLKRTRNISSENIKQRILA